MCHWISKVYFESFQINVGNIYAGTLLFLRKKVFSSLILL